MECLKCAKSEHANSSTGQIFVLVMDTFKFLQIKDKTGRNKYLNNNEVFVVTLICNTMKEITNLHPKLEKGSL